ncbi:MAG: rhodanese-like domain-containing protein [Firmicutes bacterium]|nr:rhodanese-like domain-containing protein [Bacillota bacterium]MDY5856590.1 rhodanese-like domain-containing protein [Anaerovoracaceae bacterium]
MRIEEREVDICEYLKHPFEEALLLDVRDASVFTHGSLPGAVNLPLSEIGRLYDLPRDRKICVFCQAGEISRSITELLLDAGYDAYHLAGGYREYIQKVIGPTLHEEPTGEEASE